MAYLIKRKNSGFWWLRHRDHQGRLIQRSTKLRIDSPRDSRLAELQRLEQTRLEVENWVGDRAESYDAWVPSFLKQRYEGSPLSFIRYEIAWRRVGVYLRSKHIAHARQLTYQACIGYIEWRRAGDRKLRISSSGLNTALLEVKLLSLIQKEAVRRGLATHNPALCLGIKRARPKEKLEIPDEDLQRIQERLKTHPSWMQRAWSISLYTGCRLTETRIHIPTAVNFDSNILTFARTKGGKSHSIPMHQRLRDLLLGIRTAGEAWSLDFPPMPAKHWWQFFQDLALPYCFHCLRVTFITRGARAGIAENVMMRLVGHAGTTIHRIYQRLRVEDLAPAVEQLFGGHKA